MERMMIRTAGKSLAMRSAASRPLRPGMAISISTTSGGCALTRFKTSRPSPASPMTFTSGNFSSSARMPARTSVWSSARMTAMGLTGLCSRPFGFRRRGFPFQRKPGVDFGAFLRNGLEFQSAAGQRRPLFHAQQSETGPAHGQLPDSTHIKADAVVAHAQVKLSGFFAQFHVHGFCVGVAHHIGQGFLGHAESIRFQSPV